MRRWPQIVHSWMFSDMEFFRIAELLKYAGADGFDLAVHLNGTYSYNDMLCKAAEHKSILGDADMSVPAITPLYFEQSTELCSDDAKVRQSGIDFTERCVDVAVEYGCGRVLVSPSWVSVNQRLSVTYDEHMKYAADAVAQVARYAAPLGVELLIEPINRYRVALIHTVGEAKKLIEMTGEPNVHIVADVYHMHLEEPRGVVNAIYEAGAKELKCLHIGDNSRKCPGYGALDWYEILAALDSIGFEGPLSYEPVELYFSERRVAAEPEYAMQFATKLKNGFTYLDHIMTRMGA